jgi:hypothetical protein
MDKMSKKQEEYWRKIISVIITSEDVIRDIADLDNDAVKAEAESNKRLKFLTENYLLRRNPYKNDRSFFSILTRKPPKN